tara:strand:- start:33 stop:263 length:231 start_codon:yes stop_codon:yes gene_type:complete
MKNNRRFIKLLFSKTHFTCEICNKSKLAQMYKYRNLSYVLGYIPHTFEKICKDCLYKEVYGTKNWRKKKKEDALEK